MPIYISHLTAYLPPTRLCNEQLATRTGKPDEWFFRRTGIVERRRASAKENATTLAIAVVQKMIDTQSDALRDVDLIIAGSYTPNDTLATIAHRVQRHFSLVPANALYVSTACCTFLSSLELAELYLNSSRAKRILLVLSEHNSGFSSDDDAMSGHLWGDGAASLIVEHKRSASTQYQLEYVKTESLAHLGTGPDALGLDLSNSQIYMPNGREVFAHACQQMVGSIDDLLLRTGMRIQDIGAFVPHQANQRILDNVAERLGVDKTLFHSTIKYYGNTGCASIPITLAERIEPQIRNTRVVCVAFGGGFSAGAALLNTVE